MKPHIQDFFKFLESKENRKVPFEAKLLNPDKFGSLTKEELNVKGNLNLAGINATTLPDNLTVGGSLWLIGSKIKSLPDNFTVGGTLYLTDSTIEFLSDNLTVGGSLYLWNTSLAKKMTSKQIRQEIEQKGGYVKGRIFK
jgi:hypothetical protein